MTEQAEIKTCHKVHQVTEIRLTIEPPTWVVCPPYQMRDETTEKWFARQARQLRSWADELNGFLRDHRSRDADLVDIEKVTGDVCSACQSPWEPYTDDEGGTVCAHCGAPIVADEQKTT